ncbi:hypothetical protein PspLS_08703 [Pyricularia sp. CBS 133598]|nr:hypothetical protein PspLS_08703 [Pyricularia sp. CBS 133598]
MTEFGSETTAEAVVKQFPDQVQGRTFVLNGVSPGGIGAEIAARLAEANPSRLFLIANNDDSTASQSLLDEVKGRHATVTITVITGNPSSISSVKQAAEEILTCGDVGHIDVLMNIPIEMPRAYTETEDGFEYLLQTNYLSQFFFTNTIMPKVLKAERPRIINISSSANKIAGMRWHDLNFKEPGSYEPWTAYGQTKTAAILFTTALNAKFGRQGQNLCSYAVHPGGVRTKLQEQLSSDALEKAFEGTKKRFGEETAKEFFRWKTLSAAGSTPLRAALDPSLPSKAGFWLEDCELLEESIHLHARATNLDEANRLWELSNSLLRTDF